MQLRFGENNMRGCEIMLKDLADSKRINTNIKAAVAAEQSQHGLDPVSLADDAGYRTPPATVGLTDSHSQATLTQSPGSQNGEIANVGGDKKLPLDVLEATIISSLFWPPFQVVSLCLESASRFQSMQCILETTSCCASLLLLLLLFR